MNLKSAGVILGLMLVAVHANAMDVSGYRKTKSESLELAQLYMAGVGAGLMAANAEATDANRPFYCQPGKLALNGQNYLSIVDEQITYMQSLYKGVENRVALEQAPVSLVLMYGLQRTFPCQVPDPS